MEDDVDAFDDEKSIEQTFKSAASYLRQIGSSYDTEKLLYFYARFKQVLYNLSFIFIFLIDFYPLSILRFSHFNTGVFGASAVIVN